MVLVHVCSWETAVRPEGCGTGTDTGMDMSLVQVLVLLWPQQGHWCQFW